MGVSLSQEVCLGRKRDIHETIPFENCTFDFLLDYRNWLLDYKKHTRSTVNNRLAAIKSYVRYASSRDVSLQ
ncbi:phage integrase SAM-like domain-containing protein [Ruminococcus albus]|uniref:phage integrase SAM-like domain-containing protein n=1 Tax=Ruminococcus albus TaxID=1264 RepID=UPI000ABA6522